MSILNFIVSDVGAQWIYLIMAVEHLFIASSRYAERWMIDRGYPIDPPLRILAWANWLYMVAFIMAVAINGEHPRVARAVMMPYSRFVWMLIAIVLGAVVVTKTMRIATVWRRARERERKTER